MKTTETMETTVRTTTQPASPSKERVLREIGADARIQPEKFTEDSTVPFGGE